MLNMCEHLVLTNFFDNAGYVTGLCPYLQKGSQLIVKMGLSGFSLVYMVYLFHLTGRVASLLIILTVHNGS